MFFHRSTATGPSGPKKRHWRAEQVHFQVRIKTILIANAIISIVIFIYIQYRRFEVINNLECYSTLMIEEYTYDSNHYKIKYKYYIGRAEAQVEAFVELEEDPRRIRLTALHTRDGNEALYYLERFMYVELLLNHYKNMLSRARHMKYRFWQALRAEPPKPLPPKSEDVFASFFEAKEG